MSSCYISLQGLVMKWHFRKVDLTFSVCLWWLCKHYYYYFYYYLNLVLIIQMFRIAFYSIISIWLIQILKRCVKPVFIWCDKWPVTRDLSVSALTIVSIIPLCLILPYDRLHPLLCLGNKWTQMWPFTVPEFWLGCETLSRFVFLQPCQNVISGLDSCAGKTLM